MKPPCEWERRNRETAMSTILVLMGVSGSGKTTIGRELAVSLNWEFSDADEFHSAANKEKMRNAVPLTDEDRGPWLDSIRAAIEQWERHPPGHVLACSALKERYRKVLSPLDPDVRFVYLRGSYELIAARLGERKGHYFNPALLRSQFDALEEPSDALTIDVALSPKEIIDVIVAQLAPKR
jgi:gluconokinase